MRVFSLKALWMASEGFSQMFGLEYLFVIALFSGCLTVFFEVAYQDTIFKMA